MIMTLNRFFKGRCARCDGFKIAETNLVLRPRSHNKAAKGQSW